MGKKLPSEDGTIVTEVDEVSLLKQIAALTGLKEDEIKAMSPEEQMKLLENLKQGSAELGMVVTDSLEGAEVIAADEGDESEEDSAKLADTDDKAASKGDSKAEDETIDAPLLALDKAAATAEKAKSQEGEQQMGWPDADKSARKAATQDGMAAVVREAVLNAAEEKSDKILAQSAIADKAKTDTAGKLGAAVAAAATSVGADGKSDKAAAKDVLASLLKAEVKGTQTAAEVRSPVSDAIHQRSRAMRHQPRQISAHSSNSCINRDYSLPKGRDGPISTVIEAGDGAITANCRYGAAFCPRDAAAVDYHGQ